MAKTCTKCKTEKPLSDYYFRKERGKHSASCKECAKQAAASKPPEDAEARKQYRKQYYQTNKEKVRAKIDEWNAANRDKLREARSKHYQETKHEKRIKDLKKAYNLEPGEYERMLIEQGGACAICGSTDHRSSRTKHFAVDHDHRTGEVRGVLCHSCNKGIGLLQDNPEVLKAAASYLERQKS